jgi:D-serine deaminase-like pyridoxal phosphate-dependent protein
MNATNATVATVAALLRERRYDCLPFDEPVPLSQVPTPALLLDRNAFERNLRKMGEHLRSKGKGFRPHSKTHKCPLIARAQLDQGAVGVCAAKVSEALVLCHAGIDRVLITSPVTTIDKASLVAELAGAAPDLMIVVDSELGVARLEVALADHEGALKVLIDLDPRMGRTGVREQQDVVRLANRIAESQRLRLMGVQHYAGHVMHIEGHAARREASLKHWQRASEIVAALRQQGFEMEIVTGGGTGTYDIDCDVGCVTDLQVGSYVFMDQEYLNIGSATGPINDDFETSLTVLTTAISQPASGAITVDAGTKGFASETVAPTCMDVAGSKFVFAGDEHGIVVLGEGSQQPLLGEKLQFVTPHCDPTVNLYDHYWVHQDGLVTELWPVTARGCSW